MLQRIVILFLIAFCASCADKPNKGEVYQLSPHLSNWSEDVSKFSTLFLSDTSAEARHFSIVLPAGPDSSANCVFFLAPANARFHLWLNDSLLIETKDVPMLWPSNAGDEIMIFPNTGDLRPYLIQPERWKELRRKGASLLRLLIITSDDSDKWMKSALFAGSAPNFQSEHLPPLVMREFQQGDLPVLSLDLSVTKDFRNEFQPCELHLNTAAGALEEFFYAECKQRGYSSSTFPKRQFSLHLLNEKGKKMKSALLDLPGASRWILQGPYADRSLVRNAFVCELWRQMGYWSPQQRFVEVLINKNYMGVYVLTQRPDACVNDQDAGIDYLIQSDRPKKKDQLIHAANYTFILEKKCDDCKLSDEEITAEINEWISSLTLKGNRKDFMDTASFADFFLVQEMTKNVDAYIYSSFISRKSDSGHLFLAGPVWDFDRAIGAGYTRNGISDSGWMVDSLKSEQSFWPMLLKDENFRRVCRERYHHWRAGLWNEKSLNDLLKRMNDAIGHPARERDAFAFPMSEKFAQTHAVKVIPSAEHLSYIQSWIAGRLKWMDNEFR